MAFTAYKSIGCFSTIVSTNTRIGFLAFVEVRIALLGSSFSIFRPVQSKDIELVAPSVDSQADGKKRSYQ